MRAVGSSEVAEEQPGQVGGRRTVAAGPGIAK